jgi:hypothetical protein
MLESATISKLLEIEATLMLVIKEEEDDDEAAYLMALLEKIEEIIFRLRMLEMN